MGSLGCTAAAGVHSRSANLVKCEYAPLRPSRAHTPGLVGTALSSVDLAAVAHTDDLNEQDRVMHLVPDAVVTDSHAIGAGFTGHRDAAGRAGCLAEQVDGCTHALLLPARQRLDGLDRPSGQLHPVAAVRRAHASPRSALTCSQGT